MTQKMKTVRSNKVCPVCNKRVFRTIAEFDRHNCLMHGLRTQTYHGLANTTKKVIEHETPDEEEIKKRYEPLRSQHLSALHQVDGYEQM